MDGQALSAPLGPLPPMKIHCAQLVEGALRQALDPQSTSPAAPALQSPTAPTLVDSFTKPADAPKKIVIKKPA
jgi:hypothetical protein